MRLFPRIPDFWLGVSGSGADKPLAAQTFRGLSQLTKNSSHVKIPQRLFNPLQFKSECRKELSKIIGKNVYLWKDMMFRNGFLFHKFHINKLVHENVCPMLDEVRRF